MWIWVFEKLKMWIGEFMNSIVYHACHLQISKVIEIFKMFFLRIVFSSWHEFVVLRIFAFIQQLRTEVGYFVKTFAI